MDSGRPPHGGRGLKSRCLCDYRRGQGRPPHGGRGLKFAVSEATARAVQSPSPRRAWIEMFVPLLSSRSFWRRPPHGGRGLKFFLLRTGNLCILSPSPRRAWIEIFPPPLSVVFPWSPSPRRAWIEIRSIRWALPTATGRPPHGGRGLKYK